MSAPVTERTKTATRGRTATIPSQRGAATAPVTGWGSAPVREPGTQRSATKAYARRDDRLRRLIPGRQPRSAPSTGRTQFVLLIMVLLAVGLVATLWLSTAAAADSYRLQDAKAEAESLSEQSERLRREVAAMESAPELARRAAQLGMVPVQDPARLVVAPDGSVTVVGEPEPAPPAPRPEPGTAAAAAAAAGGPAREDGGATAPSDEQPAAPAGQQPSREQAGDVSGAEQHSDVRAQQATGTDSAADAGTPTEQGDG
ncbi:hypothetical protein [Pseudonocardia nigra]|uniref:hypothetical protein n=1 Tax=Pseudonocardia nigra TaxID=1921578 RepID=UPI001C5E09E8|nr:hypothetical protein [Pseudonocardia nigra]